MNIATYISRFSVSVSLILFINGCGGNKLPLGKVEGKVLYRGQPLQYGVVLFQPEKGPAARGDILPDGTFAMSTFADNDGAVIGRHAVQIRCTTSHAPNAPSQNQNMEASVGRSLIPSKYTQFTSSGLTAEVAEENEPIVYNLQ